MQLIKLTVYKTALFYVEQTVTVDIVLFYVWAELIELNVVKLNKLQKECTKLLVLCWTNRDRPHCFVLRVNSIVATGQLFTGFLKYLLCLMFVQVQRTKHITKELAAYQSNQSDT